VLDALEKHDAERAERDMRHHLSNAREALTNAYARASAAGEEPAHLRAIT
jgi:DNA-binding GntR family transcriptional regulator